MLGDPLHPFMNAKSNRDEVFYIEFDGFLCNTSMNLIASLLLSPSEYSWFVKYPGINAFRGMKSDVIYNLTRLYNPYELLLDIKDMGDPWVDGEIPMEMIFDDVKDLMQYGYMKYLRVTSFAFALYRIINERCMKKCYIQSDYPFFDWQKDWIRSIFHNMYMDKLELLEGPSFFAYKEVEDEVTTVLINFPQILDTILETKEDKDLSEKLYLVRPTHNNIQINEETKEEEYIDPDFTDKYAAKGLKTGIIFTEPIDEDPLSEVILK